jgi:hypothetical protein
VGIKKRVAGIPATRSSKSNHTTSRLDGENPFYSHAPDLSSLDPGRFD